MAGDPNETVEGEENSEEARDTADAMVMAVK